MDEKQRHRGLSNYLLSNEAAAAVKLLQSCLALYGPKDCSPPVSSAHGIFQARILEQVAIFYSRDLPDPGIKPVSLALAVRFFTISTSWEVLPDS